MPLAVGDFILIDYTVKIKDENKVIDTTIEDEAKKADIYDENRIYGPELMVIGEGWFLKGLEDEIQKFDAGTEATIELPPEKAFGKRDPSKIRTIPARELSRRGIIPRINSEVEIGGRKGIIKSVGGGRVVVDFNHPLAGKTLVYEIKILKKLEKPEEKVAGLVHRWIKGLPLDKIKVQVAKTKIKIILPEDVLRYSNIGLLKSGIARDISKFFKEISTVEFIERIKIRKEEKSSKPTP